MIYKCGTCHGVPALVWQIVNGSEQVGPSEVLIQVKLGSDVRTVLDHTHSGLVVSELKRSRHGCHETADEFEIVPADTPRAVHQEHQVTDGTG